MSLINKNRLKVNSMLIDFINNEAIPGTDIEPDNFWKKFENVVYELTPINKALIKKNILIFLNQYLTLTMKKKSLTSAPQM